MKNIFETGIFQKNIDSKAEFEESDEDNENVSVSDEMRAEKFQKVKERMQKSELAEYFQPRIFTKKADENEMSKENNGEEAQKEQNGEIENVEASPVPFTRPLSTTRPLLWYPVGAHVARQVKIEYFYTTKCQSMYFYKNALHIIFH